MKILYVTDLHGNNWKYDRLFKTAKEFEATIVINGGDMLPKSGNLFKQDNFVTGFLDNHFQLFNSEKIYYLCCLGNDDLKIFDGIFEKTCSKYPYIINLAQRKFKIEDFEFIGMNWVVDYPFRLKDRCRMDTEDYIFQEQNGTGLLSTENGWEEIADWFSYVKELPTIEDELNKLVRPEDQSKSIYIIHMPPNNLGLDKCGHGPEVGSKAVYNFLREKQPALSLHGHIHESPETSGKWYAKPGNSTCIQPGQLSRFTYVTIDLQTMQFERYVIAK